LTAIIFSLPAFRSTAALNVLMLKELISVPAISFLKLLIQIHKLVQYPSLFSIGGFADGLTF
jgi:hypothetical protein